MSRATAFFYQTSRSKLYLVTNWHVVTGRKVSNPACTTTGAIPSTLGATLHRKQERVSGQRNVHIKDLKEEHITINSEDGNEPRWFEHSVLGPKADVVCIPLDEDRGFSEKFDYNIVNKWKEFHEKYDPEVMDDAFVIGYPWGLSGSGKQGAVPLYKKGCIASDPIINYSGTPTVLVDCRTTDGMSGSPVLASRAGLYHPDGKMSKSSIFGTVSKFIGVYSGRLYDQRPSRELNLTPDLEQQISEIGVVWKSEVIEDIVGMETQGSTLQDILKLCS